ncbi:Electroneutral sodium bicarbonate exchanger 1 [Cichlidogyrus casuarinus]|uniref:Electroneutral sodium bicarbonate exchanger 1 n=1 Tax=Cichlidogyrus casuarinus TaxID=1844966 RepID=A0ABD2PZM4_9PLAT
MFLLGENDGEQNIHKIFCELDELHDCSGVGDFEWKESARLVLGCLTFEEDVEENGERWSKPHVATLSLFSLFEVRNYLDNATMLLDLDAKTMDQIASQFFLTDVFYR